MDDSSTPSANPRSDLAAKLKSANNILVTVSRNPSVDQLASCIGLTLLLNKQGKHAAAVFSGDVPSTLEFLKPEETLEKNTDSLRDFIIALDKSKADKLRYKVEDQVVRIFITPYRTSISEDDLNFSQGDFNVDVVVALGVQNQDDVDQAITAHGRILHDATVATINTVQGADLGSINWTDESASSLCELVTGLSESMGKELIDEQIATALLTGIVAETARFSNEKTSSNTMNVSAALMAAGANQQLVASRLDDQSGNGASISSLPAPQDGQDGADGSLEITHADTAVLPDVSEFTPAAETPADAVPLLPATEAPLNTPVTPSSDEALGTGPDLAPPESLPAAPAEPASMPPAPKATEMPSPNTVEPNLTPAVDPLSIPVLKHNHMLGAEPATGTVPPPSPTDMPAAPEPAPQPPVTTFDVPPPSLTLPSDVPAGAAAMPEPTAATPAVPGLTPPPASWAPSAETPPPAQTLSDIETSVQTAQPTVVAGNPTDTNLDAARDEVSKALGGTAPSPAPTQALNAQPMVDHLHPDGSNQAVTDTSPEAEAAKMAFDPSKFEVANDPDITPSNPMTAPVVNDPTAPPPVPPPIPFQFGNTPPAQ